MVFRVVRNIEIEWMEGVKQAKTNHRIGAILMYLTIRQNASKDFLDNSFNLYRPGSYDEFCLRVSSNGHGMTSVSAGVLLCRKAAVN